MEELPLQQIPGPMAQQAQLTYFINLFCWPRCQLHLRNLNNSSGKRRKRAKDTRSQEGRKPKERGFAGPRTYGEVTGPINTLTLCVWVGSFMVGGAEVGC